MTSPWPVRLWIVRHGQSAGNVARDHAHAAGLGEIDLDIRDVDVPLAYHALPRRLARWLLATADRTGSLSFPLTQEYMAVMAGTQRTSVNATAADFKKRGLINYSRGNVTILNRPALEKEACECYRAVHEIEADIEGVPLRAFGA